MRLKEEATVARVTAVRPLHIHNGVGLNILRGPHTVGPDGANEPTGGLNGTQWLSNYENPTASIVDASENIAKHQQQQQLHLITNNNLDNARSGCEVIADDNSNHHEDDNRAVLVLPANQQQLRSHVPAEDAISSMSVSSPDDSLVGDCEDPHKIPSSVDASPAGDEEEEEEEEEEEDSGGESSTSSSSDSLLSDGSGRQGTEGRRQRRIRRSTGILNPNYPGFQRYAKRLHFARAAQEEEEEEEEEDEEEEEEQEVARDLVVEPDALVARNINNNNANNNNDNNNGEELNQLGGVIKSFDKSFIYDKSKLNIPVLEEEDEEEEEEPSARQEASTSDEDAGFVEEYDREKDLNVDAEATFQVDMAAGKCAVELTDVVSVQDPKKSDPKMADAYLSGTKEEIGVVALDPNKLFGDENAEAGGDKEENAVFEASKMESELQVEVKAKEQVNGTQKFEENLSEGEEKFMKEQIGGKKEMGGAGKVNVGETVPTPSAPPRKKEKMEINYNVRMATAAATAAAAVAAAHTPPSAPLAPDLLPLAHQVSPVAPKNSLTRLSNVKMKQTLVPTVAPATTTKSTPAWVQVTRREGSTSRNISNRRSVPAAKDKRRTSPEILGGFDVYNIETAMPNIDLEAIESHLRAAKEEERRRRNDREEIRRRLAMGPEADDYYGSAGERQGGRKPSLQSRLQSGMNLQICFMNETVSDGESPTGSECESPSSSPTTPSTLLSSSLPSCIPSSPRTHCRGSASVRDSGMQSVIGGTQAKSASVEEAGKPIPPRSLSLKSTLMSRGGTHSLPGQQPPGLVGSVVGRWDILGSGGRPEQHPMKWDGEDFFGRQARLQAEARVALAQAKEMAHMQMEVERQRQKVNSPITQMVRASLLKVGLVFPADRRRVSRQMLTEMNVAQLQVIVNDLHTQIEVLNEDLVKLLMERDDLHMEQDSMLVDIEDLTRYLGAKEKALKESGRASGCGRSSTNTEGGSRGVGGGSLPSLPLIFRQAGASKAGQGGGRPRIGSLLSKK